MKKIIISIFLLVTIFCLTSCITITDTSKTNKIVIKKYGVNTLYSTYYETTIEDKEQVKYICDNLNSLSLKKMSYNKPTMIEYELIFYNNDNEIKKIDITGNGWIGYDNHLHTIKNGEIDLEYIDAYFKHEKHTGIWHRTKIGHLKTYTCGCPSEEGTVSHIDSDEDGYCDECNYELNSNKSEIQLENKMIYVGNYSHNVDAYKDFFEESGLYSKRYLIIDNYEYYKEIVSIMPENNILTLSKEESGFFDEKFSNSYFENFVIILNLRFISGSMFNAGVNYFYNLHLTEPAINKEYINKRDGEIVIQVFVGYAIDVIAIPKEYYNKLNK